MRRKTAFFGTAIAAVGLVLFGVSMVFAAHENGEATNGGCDDFYWQSREPGENRLNEASTVTASTSATAQVVISQQIDIPCDGTQQITFNTSASANAGTYLQTYVRLSCLSGDCTNKPAPFIQPGPDGVRRQICAPGDNMDLGNNRGMVILGNSTTSNDFRAGVSQTTFCGATPPGPGQIAEGTYLVEVFAYQTNATGTAAGAGARLDERALSIEMWGDVDSDRRGDDDRRRGNGR